MVLCLESYREGVEGGTESSCPGGGGGGWGESSFPGGEGGGKPYTIYFFTLNKSFFICQIDKNNLFF